MAVAHSASSESHTGTTGSVSQASFSWTHTQTGTPQGVLVFVHVTNNATDTVTSVTYGAVTLTRVPGGAAVDAAGEPGRTDLFFAGAGLPAGNQTVTVNRLNNTRIMYATAATVTAATDTNVLGIVLLEGDGTLAQQNVNDGSPGSNSVRYAGAFSGLNAPPAAGANSTLLQSIDLGNQTAALVRETTAGQGSRPVGFSSGTTDDRAVVHVAVRELFNRTELSTVGTFTLTGNAATFTKASPKAITADVGTFTLTGNPANLTQGYRIDAERGQFTLTGGNPSLAHNVVLAAETGTFSLTGNPIAATRDWSVSVEVGTFTLTGNDVAFTAARVLAPVTGEFALTGLPAALTKTAAKEIDTLLGEFSLTGNSITFVRAYLLNAETGSFTLFGNNVALARTYALNAETGSFTLSGKDAVLTYGAVLLAERGTFNLTGNDVTFSVAAPFTVETGVFTLTGNDVTLSRSRKLDPSTGTFNLTGFDVNLQYAQRRRVVLIF